MENETKKYASLESLRTFKENSDNLYATRTTVEELSTDVAYINAEDNENVADAEIDSTANAVLYTVQTLTEEQQAQARENIGATSIAYVVNVFEELKMLIQSGNTDGAVAVLDAAILDLSTLA